MRVALDAPDHPQRWNLDERHHELVVTSQVEQVMTEYRHGVRQRTGRQVTVARGIEVRARLAIHGPMPAISTEVEVGVAAIPAGLDPDAGRDELVFGFERVARPVRHRAQTDRLALGHQTRAGDRGPG